jgi:hypothetical protein
MSRIIDRAALRKHIDMKADLILRGSVGER